MLKPLAHRAPRDQLAGAQAAYQCPAAGPRDLQQKPRRSNGLVAEDVQRRLLVRGKLCTNFGEEFGVDVVHALQRLRNAVGARDGPAGITLGVVLLQAQGKQGGQ